VAWSFWVIASIVLHELSHGWAANAAVLLDLAAAASRAGHPVLLFDFRSHGRSDDALAPVDSPENTTRDFSPRIARANSADARRSTSGKRGEEAKRIRQQILDTALENDLDAPFACRAGVCSTCRCRVLEGEVEMVANHALEDYEVEKGYVLSCQSYPVSDSVVVDYDQ